MQVFIVSQGETHEGSRVKAVFDSIEKARAYAAELRVKITEFVDWRVINWVEESPDYWEEDAVDFVSIRAWEVQ